MHLGIDASRASAAQRTGTEAYAYFLIQALLPLAVARGHTVHLYFNQPPPAGTFPAGPQIQHHPLPFPRLWTHLRLAAHLHRHPPDVFFTPAHVIPFSYHRPSVATVHDLGYHHFPQAHTRRQAAYLRWSTRHNARRARRLLADSQATRQDLARLYDVDPAKIVVVYPGRDPTLTPITDPAQLATATQRYGLTPPYLLHLGTLQPRKNLVRLVQAYAASSLPHQLVLAGKTGWLAEPILAAIAALPPEVRARIKTPGFVAETDKAALLSGATALLYPSLYEGFGFPVLEAQACGTPVLCADNSSLPEVAGQAALLHPAGDTAALTTGLRQIALDEALRARLIPAGLANVQRFNWEQSAGQSLAVLEVCLERGPS